MVESGSNDPVAEAQRYINLAKELEAKEKWEPAYKNYHLGANKILFLIRKENDASRKAALTTIANDAVTQA
eukprot:CAMPEP_0176351576 /NCGR_PEP_ID=MMETSP0126-20121128/10333_1 /TAXON_ID=141414 ORGANISM="Strombidinopsis acuminatum, Strain SPMC142" /NCGR_SAMPLE_ID=MMETSP0126 /ASSEMBLY_ACC=CAM_ASM_000229 /LENGTH=70 /DNA_ID=CAMNT_0017702165 /DNA_START=13 /DNA_END=225 /DNA_ORIENTATION=+